MMDILDSAPFGFALHEIITDDAGRPVDYRVLQVNQAFERLTGLRAGDILGRRVREVMPSIGDAAFEWIKGCRMVAMDGGARTLDHYSEPLGRWYQVQVHCPEPGTCSTLFVDISEQKRAMGEVEAQERRYESLVAHIPGIVYRCLHDGHRTMLYLSDEVRRLTGHPPDRFLHNARLSFERVIHPVDQDRVRQVIGEAVSADRSWDVEYRLVRPDGAATWVRDRGQAHRNTSESVEYLDGLILEITAERRAEKYLKGRLSLEKMAARASSRFLSAATADQFSEAVERTLADLGALFSVDRSYLFEVSPGLSRMDNTHEWRAPGVESQQDRLRDIPMDSIPWARDQLVRGDPLIISDVASLPPEAWAEKEMFTAQGIRSMANVPVRGVDGRFLGFIGFDSIRRSLAWSDDQVAILRVLADLVGSAMARLKSQERLKSAKEAAEAASKAHSEFLANLGQQIQTPLNDLIGFTELLLETPLDQVQATYAGKTQATGRALLEAIRRNLDLSRTETGKVDRNSP
ncbi:MAG: PAS domain S-box protein [Gemmatimonadales bacterium]|nr:MAG: PAS domain S-box protein [Gemmatimonadales bacterium]